MCHASCVIFGATSLNESEVKGRRVAELGSRDVNGSLRKIVALWAPAEYVGLDIEPGPGVDIVCPAENAVEKLGAGTFDLVISTEMLEHARDWRKVVSNIKNLCKPGGTLLVTTRSFGFGYHSYPYDFWRFEPEDFRAIFSDCELIKLEKDAPDPGVFLKARKPLDFKENELSRLEMYSMIAGKRVRDVDSAAVDRFLRKLNRYQRIRDSVYAAGKFVVSKVLGL